METKLINLKVYQKIISPLVKNIFNSFLFILNSSANKEDQTLY